MKDLLGVGKILPIDKLVEVVCKGVGRISKSYFDKKDIDSKAYEIKKLAEARAEEMSIISNAVKENFQITGGIVYKDEKVAIKSPKSLNDVVPKKDEDINALELRTQNRISYQEKKQQLNIENITTLAAEELKYENEITNESLDEDWINRFFKIASDVSNEEMQMLWGKILAGEIKKPKSYSLRTLELLKNLSQFEADIFVKFGSVAIKYLGVYFMLDIDEEDKLKEKYKLSYYERLILQELGLVNTSSSSFTIDAKEMSKMKKEFSVGEFTVELQIPLNSSKQNLSVLLFTTIGNELMDLVNRKCDLDYVQLLASQLRRKEFSLKYKKILKVSPNQEIEFSELEDVPLTDLELQNERKREERLKEK